MNLAGSSEYAANADAFNASVRMSHVAHLLTVTNAPLGAIALRQCADKAWPAGHAGVGVALAAAGRFSGDIKNKVN
jgi:hypothetical protein